MSYFEICPNCNSDDVLFNRKKNFSRCEQCGFTDASSEKQLETSPELSHSIKAKIDLLPFPLALCFYEYARETNPYLQLHRLTDAAEMLTRFLTIVALSDILRLQGDFPDQLKEELEKRIERPTFGAWKELLRVAVISLEKGKQKNTCFVAGLPDYVNKTLLPLLGSDGNPEQQIIPLRNLLAHQGRLSDKQAAELLAQHRTQFERLFQELDFLNDYDLIACVDEAALVYLRGLPQEDDSFPAYTNSIDSIQFTPEAVYLLHQGQALNLFPLQIFSAVLRWRDDVPEPEKTVEAASQIYFRASGKGQLDFTPLTDQALFAHQRGAALESFNQIFCLEKWRKTIAAQKGIQISAFDDLLRELLAVFVGREADVKTAKEKLRHSNGGVLWISGQPGVGKSALMAKLIADYQNSQHHFVFPYLFRLGHTGCSVDSFLKAALAQLYKAISQPANMGAHVEERRTLFINLVREASQTLKQKIWFLIDGVDEIYRLDKSFLSLPFAASGERVVWLCAGRNEPPEMEESLRQQGAQRVFDEGLGVLDEKGIRAMLLEHLEPLKYLLFERDKQKFRQTAGETPSTFNDSNQSDLEWSNEFIDTLTRRSERLPLYVRMAIDDLQTGKLTVNDEKKLPEGLSAYFEQILERLRVSDVGTVLTPLFCLLVWAKEPVTEAALQELMSGHHLSQTSRWQESFQYALRHGHLMLRQERTPEGDSGWTFYHDSFRRHLQNSSQIQDNREWAQSEWLNKCSQWQKSEEKSLRFYALRHYALHLHESKRWGELFALARNLLFRNTQEQAFPHNPNLTLQPLQLALQRSAEIDDAGAMAEFLLMHAKQLIEITQESPLDTLRTGQIQRAWELADLFEIERSILWYLLLVWELKDTGRLEHARATLERLMRKELPKLSEQEHPHWQGKYATYLLRYVPDVSEDALNPLQEQLLGDDESRAALCEGLTKRVRFSEALETAQRIENDQRRAPALREIAKAQAEAGEKEAARETFASALQTAQRIEDASSCALAISEIAKTQIGVSEIAAAIETTKRIKGDYWRAEALSEIAKAQAEEGQKEAARETFAAAIETAKLVGSPLSPTQALKYIAKAQTEAGEMVAAIETAQSIESDWLRSREEALREIAKAQAQAGDFTAALETAQSIENVAWRSSAQIEVAIAQAQAGDKEAARQTFTTALQTARRIEGERQRAEALREIAKAQAKAGEKETARETFATAIETAQRIERTEGWGDYWRETALTEIAKAQAEAGYIAAAIETANSIGSGWKPAYALSEIAKVQAKAGNIAAAIETAQSIELVYWRVESLIQIAEVQDAAGEKEAAREIFAAALQTAQRIKDEEERAFALSEIAKVQVEAGGKEAARETFVAAIETTQSIEHESSLALIETAKAQAEAGDISAAIQTAKSIENAERRVESLREIKEDVYLCEGKAAWRAKTLREIAEAQVETGEKESAQETFAAALETTWGIEGEWELAWVLGGIARAQAEAGEIAAAIETAQRIPNYYRRAFALSEIAMAQAQAGEKKGAKETITVIMEMAKAIESALSRTEVLRETAKAQAAVGEKEAAGRTFAAAVETAKRIEMLPSPHPLVEIARAQVKVDLGTEVFQTATAMLTDRNRRLPEFAQILVEAGDRDNFKQLLLPCSYFLDAAYKMCGFLARLYPEQVESVANIVRNAAPTPDKRN